MKKIDKQMLSKFKEDYLDDDVNDIVRHALNKTKISDLVQKSERQKDNQNIFSIEIDTMPATYQKQSGRCWIFAACNILREKIGKKYNIENFELSQSYIAFYDKLEKCNYFFDIIDIILSTDIVDERLLYCILDRGIEDGGQWDMLVNIIKKYGVVPKSVYGETYQSSNTSELNNLLNRLLRKYASEVKRENSEKIREKYIKDIYKILVDCYGVPPERFDFEYKTKANEYKRIDNITPIEFYEKHVDIDLDDYVSIINSPTDTKPFNEMYTVKYLGNVVEGKKVVYLNLSMPDFKKIVIEQLGHMEPVWFGSDCTESGDRRIGFWDTQSFDYNKIFGTDFNISKSKMLDYRESSMNHAMLLTGVNIENGKSTRWKIENSWGEDNGYKGYYVASDSWFDEYVYQAVVNKKYLSETQQKYLDKVPFELEPWDPMGTLAN